MPGRDALGWTGSTLDGRYAVDSVVGEGGQGVVYRAVHLGFEEPVAIKCLKLSAHLATPEREALLASFRAEARLLHRLSRKTRHIVQAIDIGAAESPSGAWSPYIVMEWLEGRSLEVAMQERPGGWPLDEALALLAPAARGLAVAHASGVSHLDIKPGNLMLCGSPPGVLKVLDFGIAKVLSGTASLTRALVESGRGLRLFTPAYGAPEQFNPRHGARGPWTDVFALALVLIEMVSGRRALGEGDSSQLYVASADEQRRPSLATHGVRGPPAVDAVLERALAVDPAARYRNAGEMWQALEAAREPGARPARRPSAPPLSSTRTAAAAMPPSARAPTVLAARTTGENRVCTILMADVDGLDELSEELDPEEIKDVADRVFELLGECIEELGGHVDRYVGDSILAVFGQQRASDNDPERAVHAALSMQRTLEGLTLPQRALAGFRFRISIGITTGRVFVGAPGGRPGRSVTGEPVNVAARLEAAAGPGGVLISQSTHRLVSGLFQVERAQPVAARARGEPIRAYRVLGVAGARSQGALREFHRLDTKLVGRAAEMAQLEDLFGTVLDESTPRVVTLVGLPGLGKSRMLVEIAHRLRGRAAVWSAHGSPLDTERSRGGLVGFVRDRFHVHEDDPREVIHSKLRRGMRRLGAGRRDELYPYAPAEITTGEQPVDSEQLVELLARLLGAGAPLAEGELGAPNESAGHNQKRLSAAIAELLRSVAGPVVLCCDDVHWMDDSTLDTLDDLVVRLPDHPLLILCTARPALYERRPLWGEGKAAHVRLELLPLARRHLEEMARDRLRRVVGLGHELPRRVAEHAEGNPLALEETLHLLIDAGAIEVREEGDWRLHPERVGELALPPTIQGIVQARIDRLPAEEREVLMRASVVGRTFWDGALAMLDGGETRSRMTEVLGRLRDKGLISARETSLFPDEQELVFSEGAVQQVAYDSLSKKLRRRMHHLVAAWLEPRTSDAGASLLARHHELAGDLAGAVRAFRRAGSHAAELGQHQEALVSLEHAVRIDEQTAGAPARASWPADDARVLGWRERVELQLELGDVLRRVGRSDEAEMRYREARRRIVAVERRGDARSDERERFRSEARVEHRLALLEQLRGDLDKASSHIERAIEHAVQGGAIDETASMWALLAAIRSRRGDLDACYRDALKGLRVCRTASRRDGRWRAAVSELLVTLGTVFFRRARWVAAERCYLQGARVVDEATDPHQVSRAVNNLAATRYSRGDLDGARQAFRRVLALTRRSGDLSMTMTALSNLAETEGRLGNHEVARATAREAVRLAELLGAESDMAEIVRNLAEAEAALGAWPEAAAAALRALALARGDAGRVYRQAVWETAKRVAADGEGAAVRELAAALAAGD